jgi:DNA gyrase/topoisomerase IV subunit A
MEHWLMDNNEIEIDELMNHIKAPDFPTGGIIYGYEGFVKLSKLVEVSYARQSWF